MIGSFDFNDDEIKRIMMVIERDFQLREKEAKRLEEIRKNIRREHERVEYLAGSREFNASRCIRCFKPFKFLFNPKEICSSCQLYVCHDCAKYERKKKIWICKLCEQLKEWENLTARWFYEEVGRKHRRCGSAKVVRDLYKREKDLIAQQDEDLGYDTLRKSLSADSVAPYVVHDRDLRRELNEYSKRLDILVDHLQSELCGGNQAKVNVKDHLQQITSEISRARIALSRPIRLASRQPGLYEDDLQNLLIQQTEELLQIDLQEFPKNGTTTNFDQRLAQMIMSKYLKQDKSEPMSKYQRQPTEPFVPSVGSPSIRESQSEYDFPRRRSITRTPAVEEEDTEEEIDDQSQNKTLTENHLHPLTNSQLQPMTTSIEHEADWKLNCTLVESKIVPVNNEEQQRYTTWF